MCSPLFKFSHLYKTGNPECQELIFIFFLSCEGAGVMCSLTICLSSPINEKWDRKPELAAKELPPHINYTVSLVLIPNGNGKPEVTLSSPASRAAGPIQSALFNKRQTASSNETGTGSKFHRPPEAAGGRFLRCSLTNQKRQSITANGHGNLSCWIPEGC